MHITIIGNGNMAKGIATRLLGGGHEVSIHAKDEAKGRELADQLKEAQQGASVTVAPIGGSTDEVIIVALPYGEIVNVAAQYKGFLGKVLVDISNPVDFNTFQLIPAAGTSGAETIAQQLPGAKVVKAFNTNLAGALLAGTIEGKELDVFIAADDQAAKDTVAEAIRTSAMRPIDVGPLSESRHLEGFGLIQMKIQDQIGTGWMSSLKFLG